MDKIIQSVSQFRQDAFGDRRELFQRLATGQEPEALFITCSDSRIDPNLLCGADPGELFVIRNAGNIIPKYDDSVEGEAATIEYAIKALGVGDIVVCGHSHCGAVTGLLHQEKLGELPAVREWLRHSQEVLSILEDDSELEGEALLNAAIQQNVLVQLHHLGTHPSVSAALENGEVKLHGWVYHFETGEVLAYDSETRSFSPITQ